MTTWTGATQIDEIFQTAVLGSVTLSGTVEVGGIGVQRVIIVYKSKNYKNPFNTVSETDGSWTITIDGAGAVDKFTVICLGEQSIGENSVIYDFVQG